MFASGASVEVLATDCARASGSAATRKPPNGRSENLARYRWGEWSDTRVDFSEQHPGIALLLRAGFRRLADRRRPCGRYPRHTHPNRGCRLRTAGQTIARIFSRAPRFRSRRPTSTRSSRDGRYRPSSVAWIEPKASPRRGRQITCKSRESRASPGVERRRCRIAVRHHWRTTLTGVVSGRHATRQRSTCRPDSRCRGRAIIGYQRVATNLSARVSSRVTIIDSANRRSERSPGDHRDTRGCSAT